MNYFKCRVCGVECDTHPVADDGTDQQAVCEQHCDDHDYEYVSDLGGKFCKNCGKPVPDDYYNDDYYED